MAERKQVSVTFRVPRDLVDWLKSEAEQNRRSVASQVAWLLESAKRERPAQETNS